MPNELPYMPFWIKDYRQDQEVRLMPIRERGLYLELIFELWESDGKIEHKPAQIAKLLNCSSKLFNNFWKTFSHKFILESNWISHSRVTKELQKAYLKSEKARKAAEKRWGKKSKSDANASPKHKHSESKTESKTESKNNKKENIKEKSDSKPVVSVEDAWAQHANEDHQDPFIGTEDQFTDDKKILKFARDNYKKADGGHKYRGHWLKILKKCSFDDVCTAITQAAKEDKADKVEFRTQLTTVIADGSDVAELVKRSKMGAQMDSGSEIDLYPTAEYEVSPQQDPFADLKKRVKEETRKKSEGDK